jgi:dTDP-glucose pyrophosphorylase
MDGKLVILAGGISSRMKKPVSNEINIEEKLLHDANEKSKSMIGLGKKHRPFLDYLLFNAFKAGYKDIVLVIGTGDNYIKDYYSRKGNDNNLGGLNISFTVQPIPGDRNKPLGTADALFWGLKSKPEWAGSKFTVCNSDNLYSQKAFTIMLSSPYAGALIDYDRSALDYRLNRIEGFAVTIKNEQGFLKDIIEKPTLEVIHNIKDKYGYVGVSMNIFSLSYDSIFPILQEIPLHPVRNEKELPEAIRIIAGKNKNSVFAYPLAEHVPDLTCKEDIAEVQRYLEKHFTGLQ